MSDKTTKDAGPGFECDWDDGEYCVRWDNGKFLHAFASGKVVVTDIKNGVTRSYTIDELSAKISAEE